MNLPGFVCELESDENFLANFVCVCFEFKTAINS